MSSPLLQTSPTVQLEVQPDRQLAANLVLSPDATNGLRLRSSGVWAKKGQRRYPWQVAAAGQILTPSTTAKQVLNWTSEVYDPDGLADVVAFPTRVTMPADGDYFVRVNGGFIPAAGFTENIVAQALLYKNGTALVAGVDATAGLVSATATMPGSLNFSLAARPTLKAGDYLEVYVWFTAAFTPTPPVSITTGACTWSGGAITT